jgi:hypothetical protein
VAQNGDCQTLAPRTDQGGEGFLEPLPELVLVGEDHPGAWWVEVSLDAQTRRGALKRAVEIILRSLLADEAEWEAKGPPGMHRKASLEPVPPQTG